MFRPFGSSSTTTTTTMGSNIFGGGAAQQPAQPAGGNIFGGGIGSGLGGGVGGGMGTSSNTMGFGMSPFGTSAGSLPAMGAISTSVGTGNPPYTSTSDQEGNLSITLYCISAMPAYRGKSLEELRLEDYSAGKRCATSFGGSAATAAPSSIFGAQPASTGAFGGSTGGGMFGGQPAASGSVFGAPPKPAFGSPFGAPASASAGGAFGSSAASTGFGGASAFGGPSSTFGQPAQPAGQSLFGQPAPAATSAFSFGQQQQPAAPSAFGGFGQAAAAQPATASPFGAPKPPTPFGGGAFGAAGTAPASTGFGFGAQQQPAATTAAPFSFGGAQATAAPAQPGAFGQQPSGFSFGQQPPAAAQQSTGAFGFGASTTPAGSSTATAFGQQQPTGGLLSTGGGFSFGQQPQQQPAAQQPSTSLFGMQQPAAPAGGMFGAKPAGSFSFGAPTPAAPAATSAPMSFGFGQPSTASTAGTGFSLPQPTQTSNLPFIGQPDPSLLSLKPPLPSGLLTTKAPSATATTPASTSLAAAAPSDAKVPERVAASIAPRLSGFRPRSRTADKQSEAALLNVGSLVPRKASIKKLAIPKASLTDDAATAESAGSHAAALDAAGEPAALKYGEYYMLPSEAVLKKMSYSQLAAVPSLVIGQKGVGRLRFLQPVDLTGVDLDMILDNIVVFDNHQVVIYPEDEYHQTERPPAGQGLNLPAECRLERCWPTARSSRDPITEMGSERMRRHIQRLQQVPGTHFIDYIPESGTWIFKVDHF